MTYRHSFLSPLTWLRLLTHVLGHSGWEHFAGNISYVLLLGPMLEEKYGSERLLEVICITAVVTGLINFLFFPHTARCGASGVVFAFILLTSFTSFRAGEIPSPFVLVAAVFIGQQVAEGLLVRDNVSNLSHIVGGLIGAAVGYTFNRRGRTEYKESPRADMFFYGVFTIHLQAEMACAGNRAAYAADRGDFSRRFTANLQTEGGGNGLL